MRCAAVLGGAFVRGAGGVNLGCIAAVILARGRVAGSAFMAAGLVGAGSTVLLAGSLVTAFFMAHGADEVYGADEQANQDQHNPE